MISYTYVSPEAKGYRKVKLTRDEEKDLLTKFGYKKHQWINSVTMYVNDNGDAIAEILDSKIAVVINHICIPVAILIYGIANWRDVLESAERDRNQRKYGAFVQRQFKIDK